MNAKYQHLQQKIQMLTKATQDLSTNNHPFYNNKCNIDDNSDNDQESFKSSSNNSSSYHYKSKTKSKIYTQPSPSFSSSIPIPQYANLEIRLNNLESLYENSLTNIDMKYSTLSEYINKIKQAIDSSLLANDTYSNDQITTLNEIQANLHNQLTEDSVTIENYLQNSLQKTESKLLQIDNDLTSQGEFYRKECHLLQENTEGDLQAINNTLGDLVKEKTLTNAQLEKEIGDRLNEEHGQLCRNEGDMNRFYNEEYDKIKKMMFYSKQRNEGEAMKRMEFKENIVKVLKETEEHLQQF